jgi:maleylpyruvate isomerase
MQSGGAAGATDMMTLHGYWRSTASYRVRIALGLKRTDYRQVTRDLRLGEQKTKAFLALSPQGLVPAIEDEGTLITQSLAIIEWLDERWPEQPLLPADPGSRAIVRSMALLIACDIHPLNNLRVLTALRQELHAGEDQISHWIVRWIRDGFRALEELVSRHGGIFSFGDTVGLADCCLVPQIYAANRFSVDLSDFPRLLEIGERANQLEAFAAAAPDCQSDAD